jgi:hypothetical protein
MSVVAVMSFSMDYPETPLELESLQYSHTDTQGDECVSVSVDEEAEALRAAAEQKLKDFALSRAGAEEGYAVGFTELISQCQWPSSSPSSSSSSSPSSSSSSSSSPSSSSSSLPLSTPKVDDLQEVSNIENVTPEQLDSSSQMIESSSDDIESKNILEKDVDTLCQMTDASLSIFRADGADSSTTVTPNETQPESIALPVKDPAPYKCRKCRSVVFTSEHLEEPHMMTARAAASMQRGGAPATTQTPCPTLLLSPDGLPWLTEVANAETHISGSIPCPKCTTKLGVFDWSGSKCSCGQWIAPSFKITSSKIDLPP